MKRNLFLLCTLLCINMAASAVLVWDGTSAPWTNGSGTETDPYLIETPQQLSYLAELTSAGVSNYKGKYFLQTQDFDMNSKVFTSIGTYIYSTSGDREYPFSGNYNGNNKFISNLRIDGANSDVALFGYAKEATIENVIVRDTISITRAGYMAGIVSFGNSVNLSNCKNMANLYPSSANACAGGIMARAKGTCSLKNCVNEGSVCTKGHIDPASGGILGAYLGSDTCILSNCSNIGSISSYGYSASTRLAYSGGIVGYNRSCVVLSNCSNTGAIISSSSYSAYSGGMVGHNKSCTIVNCFNMGSITSTSSSTSSSASSSSYSAYSGGIVGYNESCTLTLCNNTGSVVSSSSSSYSAYSGGIVASNSSATALVINNCYARCTVKATSTKDSYAYGITDVGTIQNSYFAGTLEGKSKYGISKEGEVSNCYRNSDCGVSGGNGIGKTNAQLKSASMPVILNGSQAEPVWVMDTYNSNDGYPVFGWQIVAPSYQITGTCDAKQGVVSGSGKYATGTVVQLTASPSDGYAFVSWSDGDTTNPRSITVGTADATYTALFVKMHYTITIGQDCSTTVQ